MKKHDKRTNETLAKVIERFNVHSQQMKSNNHIVSEAAAIMHNIELWEIWALTQE